MGSKVFILWNINIIASLNGKGESNMEKIKIKPQGFSDDDLGLILWNLEAFEKFYPCYPSLMKKN